MRTLPLLPAVACAALLLTLPACGDKPDDTGTPPDDTDDSDDTGETTGTASRDLLGDATPWAFSVLGNDTDCTAFVGPLEITGTIRGSDTIAFEFDAVIVAQSIDGTGTADFPVVLPCGLTEQSFSCGEVTFEESSKHNAHVSIILSGDFDAGGQSATAESLSQFWFRDEVDCSTTSELAGTVVE
jgi:hypothetical protein